MPRTESANSGTYMYEWGFSLREPFVTQRMFRARLHMAFKPSSFLVVTVFKRGSSNSVKLSTEAERGTGDTKRDSMFGTRRTCWNDLDRRLTARSAILATWSVLPPTTTRCDPLFPRLSVLDWRGLRSNWILSSTACAENTANGWRSPYLSGVDDSIQANPHLRKRLSHCASVSDGPQGLPSSAPIHHPGRPPIGNPVLRGLLEITSRLIRNPPGFSSRRTLFIMSSSLSVACSTFEATTIS